MIIINTIMTILIIEIPYFWRCLTKVSLPVSLTISPVMKDLLLEAFLPTQRDAAVLLQVLQPAFSFTPFSGQMGKS